MSRANWITATRLIVLGPFIACVGAATSQPGWGWLAGLLFALAAASDMIDGRIARRDGTASVAGRFLDHFADIAFILGSLTTYVSIGALPWWVPASIAASFTFYVVDSLRRNRRAPALIVSRIGHAGGVANYVLIGVLVFNESAALRLLPSWLLTLLFALVPTYSLAAILGRLWSDQSD